MTTRTEAVIDRITLIVSDLDRAEDDYVRTFGCRVEQRGDIDPALIGVLCLSPSRGRRSLLRLGRERIELLEFTDMAGRPYPPSSTSTDLWFQHMAIIVDDMKSAHQRVMANRRFWPISRNGPVRLPDTSGGVTAFKFRDHDGHPLELLAFPHGNLPGQWRTVDGTGRFLGVDHTAIAVSDPASSARFFGSVFGFRTGTRTENRGPRRRRRRPRQRHPARAGPACAANGTAALPRGHTPADPARHHQQRHRGDTLCRAGRLA